MIEVGPDRFEGLVAEGVAAIPEKFLRKLDNVGIVVEEEPTAEQLERMGIDEHHTLFGLYEGVPQIKRWNYGGGVLPDKITIFRGPILAEAASVEEVRAIVRDTVWHEIAHHFGMEEDEVAAAELRRRRGQ